MSNLTSQSEKGPDETVSSSPTRRTFLGAMSAASYQRVFGANDRCNWASSAAASSAGTTSCILKRCPMSRSWPLCDAYMPRAEQCVADFNPRAKAYQDFRRVLENKNIQAVFICTPSHWHALMTIMACAAGKDVYVEKPLTVCVKEGRWMVEAARRYNRIVQTGTQQRSLPHYQKAATALLRGYMGKIASIRSGSMRKCMPGFGNPARFRAAARAWIGTCFSDRRATTPTTSNRGMNNTITTRAGSGIPMADNKPTWARTKWISSYGRYRSKDRQGGVVRRRRNALQDNCEIPDTQDSLFDFPGARPRCSAIARRAWAASGFLSCGSSELKGGMNLSRDGYEIFPENTWDEESGRQVA